MTIASKKNSETFMRTILVKLLQGFVFHDEKNYWGHLLMHQELVRNYFQKIGLYLYLNQEDGYAFLKGIPPENEKIDTDVDAAEESQQEDHEESDAMRSNAFISIVRKMPLSFDTTVLLVLLRELLEQFDEKVSDDYRLIVNKRNIYEMLQAFYRDRHDETKLFKKFDTTIKRIEDLGLIKALKNNPDNYEVKRVIKAFFDAAKLIEIKNTMKKHLAGNEESELEEICK